MTEIVIAQDAAVLVAIDIAKARHEVLIAILGKKRRRRLTVLNQMEDFQRLITSLASYGRPVRAAFEATGNYHRTPRSLSPSLPHPGDWERQLPLQGKFSWSSEKEEGGKSCVDPRLTLET